MYHLNRFRPLLGLAASAVLAMVFTACVSEPKSILEFESADLMGVVYDGRARSVQDYAITVDDAIIIRSDVNGRFTIPDLKNGKHHIKGVKPGYQTLELDIEFQHRTQFLYLTSNALADYLTDAELALAKKDFIQARANIELGLGIDPENPMTLYMQALVASNLNEQKTAYEILGKLIAKNVREEAIYLLLLDIAKNDASLRPEILKSLQGDAAIMANPRLKSRILKLISPPGQN